MTFPRDKPKFIVIDLTQVPEDWGTNEATIEYLSTGWEHEPPSCYTCGYSSGTERGPLSLKELKYGGSEGKKELFHYQCWGLYLLTRRE